VSGLHAFLVNGLPAEPGLAMSRGLHYGDGVFRTLLKHEGRVLDVDLQLRKLLDDAAALQLDTSDSTATLLAAEIVKASAGITTAVIKILLVRGGQGRGYAPQTDRADRLVFVYAAPRYPECHWTEGIDTARSEIAIAAQPALAGIKHLNRLEQVLAYRSAPSGLQEIMLCDDKGQAICGGRSNLFCVANGLLMTPDLARSGVRGVMRDKVLACAAQLNIGVRIEAMPWSRVEQADEVFVTNSLIGIWPVRSIGARCWSAPGPVTTALTQALAHPRLT
jgi:4-amino-4-deoxychorismate lyase